MSRLKGAENMYRGDALLKVGDVIAQIGCPDKYAVLKVDWTMGHPRYDLVEMSTREFAGTLDEYWVRKDYVKLGRIEHGVEYDE